ncbi:MAG TPA: metallopeptidase TldD-related protein [Vicinamibacteria bacterium]|nr:metallopeptidase TldD-related protein [Vicinamibacteria bacterium]
MDHRDLALHLLSRARALGADAADALVAEGTDFSVTVRKGEVETLKDAGSKALGLRVFVGRRTASSYTSDFSPPALETLVRDTVDMSRVTGEDPAAGLPEETPPAEAIDLGLYDPSPAALPPAERIDRARRAEAAALAASAEITNSQGGSYGSEEGRIVLANTQGFVGSYRSSGVSLSVVPVAERDGRMERDYWYTSGRGLGDLLEPEEVGRIAAERTLRRLGARKVPTCEVPVVFDPETAAELLGILFRALSGYSVFRNATFLKDKLGQAVASPLLSVVDEGRRPRGLGSRPFDGEGLGTRRNVPLEEGVLRYFMCDAYAARKIGARPTGSARRGVAGGPTVGAGNLCFAPGQTPPDQIVGEVGRGLYVTDLIGFGVDLVSGDYSQGAAGQWIENGRLVHPVHEVTIAGNLQQMLMDVDAVGSDLEWRSSAASPTVRIRRMTVSGS